MFKADHSELNIVNLDKARDTISFAELSNVLSAKPTFSIYFIYGGKLFGMICGSDILNANRKRRDFVDICKDFTTVRYGFYMEALKLFKEDKGLKVIPILDENDNLVGEYQRWDDKTYLQYGNSLFYDKGAKGFFKKYNSLALVEPWKEDVIERQLFERYCSFFEALACNVIRISRDEIENYIDQANLVVVMYENEGWGIGSCYEATYKRKYNWNKVITLRRIEDKINNYIAEECVEDVLNSINKNGAHVLSVFCIDNGSDYYKRTEKEISEKFKKAGMPRKDVLQTEWYKDYFDDLYDEEYVQKILNIGFPIIKKNGVHKLLDRISDVYNVTDGVRATVGNPAKYNQSILFFGKCFTVGYRVEDKNTIESQLQRMLNERGYSIRVMNYGCWDNTYGVLNRIASEEIYENDIVVVQTEKQYSEAIPSMNFMDILEKNDVPSKWMVDSEAHVNHRGYELFAEGIFEKLEDKFNNIELCKKERISAIDDVIIDKYIDRYFADFKIEKDQRIGAVVMNCNPFTSGHRYLIEEAIGSVDRLIVFVVQEDESLFSYDTRMACVRLGVSDLKNVYVVPSGDFILSQKTFPEYFLKVTDEDSVSNMEHDITLFAEKIAPKLNIKCRFVGEEIIDEVTRHYNEVMKRVLPKYGIELKEIKRKEVDGEIISATKVRNCLNDFNENNEKVLKKIIPETTRVILGERF